MLAGLSVLTFLIFASFFFFFTDTATTEIYTLPLHDALPIYRNNGEQSLKLSDGAPQTLIEAQNVGLDRKSTRLNSSHLGTSYAALCLKKRNTRQFQRTVVGGRPTHCHTDTHARRQ